MQVFLAGIMQANRNDNQIEDQSYRVQISNALKAKMPNVQIIDPWALNPNSVTYDDQTAFETFHAMTKLAGDADLLIAYLPKVSMGTAMEMWQAHQNGTYIIAVTPYVHHWAIRFTANEILPDLDTLLHQIENGRIPQLLHTLTKVDGSPNGD
ncbi:MAG: hypothetical protein Kow0080_20140 [Candidatus Promineifilaceae bacterium]